ncbi:MAG: XRE family transcriptional regulator, partial [Tetragenococcus halophilus]|nr:XRE family transcriptional regulator [Tetragenococcus halophilus]
MSLGKNIKALRTSRGLTQEKLSDKLNKLFPNTVNFNKGKISKWENNHETPYLSSAKVLAVFFEVTVDDLMNSDFTNSIYTIYNKLEPPRQAKVYSFAEAQLEAQNKVISIEETQTVYLNSKLSAGTGILDLDPTDTKEIEYNGYVPKHDLAFKVSGDSMYPTFEDGEIVFVEKTPDIYNGQFIAVQINEAAFLKKVYIEDDCLRLVSLNKE